MFDRSRHAVGSLALLALFVACSSASPQSDSVAAGATPNVGTATGGATLGDPSSTATTVAAQSSTGGTPGAPNSAAVGGAMSRGGGDGSGGTFNGGSVGSSGANPGTALGGTVSNGSSNVIMRGGNANGGNVAGGNASNSNVHVPGGNNSGGDIQTSSSSGGSIAGGSSSGGSTAGGEPTTPTFASADEEILYRAVRFYGAERCGDAHNWTLVGNPNGNSCHLRDGETVGLDLSGGWHDAGDHVKVTLTIAYAAYVLLKAYDTYPAAFKDFDDPSYSGKPNGVADVLDEARVGLDWLVKAHPTADKLVAMVSNSDYDHSTFMTSPKQSTNAPEKGGDPRPVQMGAKADFAGLTAAALALASRVYASSDPTLAATYLAKAKSAYAFAKANPGLSTSMLYAWTGSKYTDDLLCGAAELWRATSDATYRSDAVTQNTSIGPHKYVINYSQVSDLCRHSLVKGGENAALAPWKTDVDRYATLVSSDANMKGLIYIEKWGTCRHAMSAAFSAALLFDATKDTKYRDFARSQYAWVKGANPQSRSFIIGWGTNPPTRPHHRNAYGYEDDAGWDADTPQLSDQRTYRYLLKGGLVGGPNLEGYQDSVNDYVHNEVALDYNAGLVGTAAFALLNP